MVIQDTDRFNSDAGSQPRLTNITLGSPNIYGGRRSVDLFSWIATTTAFLCCCGCSEPPQVQDDFVRCRSLTGDRTAIPILQWEFEAVTTAVSQCRLDRPLGLNEITKRVRQHLPSDVHDSFQQPDTSISAVILELEVRGYLRRVGEVEDVSLLRLQRVALGNP